MFNGQVNPEYQDTVIENDGFWPDLNAGDFEKRRGVPLEMDKESIAYAVAASTAQINIELVNVKTAYQASGIEKAEDVVGQPKIGDKNLLVILYEKAVFARTKSELLPEYATTQMKDAGENVATSHVEVRDQLLTESQQHIRAIKGKGRTGIELL
ncbi:head completion/stabilization protein [Psychromonas ossibalaenae]|uniref:head completion/stabilization protein n=1 Tax=Psychromonas ossibalaenae TaxID=444922 RepID=UPI000381EAAD|nr:head completion/stabilization protein [Psychromonas ossibalaenae]